MRRVSLCSVPLLLSACTTDAPSADLDAGDITSGTLSTDRLPDEVLLDGEISIPDPTTDAGDLTSGTLDPARLPSEAVRFSDLDDPDNLADEVVLASELPTPPSTGVAGEQQPDFLDTIDVDADILMPLSSIDIDASGAVDVALNAHVYLEKTAADQGRYEVALVRDDCSGDVVGSTYWRAAESPSSTYQADSVSLTGFARSVPDGATFVLCAGKLVAAAPDATAGPRGLIATW